MLGGLGRPFEIPMGGDMCSVEGERSGAWGGGGWGGCFGLWGDSEAFWPSPQSIEKSHPTTHPHVGLDSTTLAASIVSLLTLGHSLKILPSAVLCGSTSGVDIPPSRAPRNYTPQHLTCDTGISICRLPPQLKGQSCNLHECMWRPAHDTGAGGRCGSVERDVCR